MVNGDTVLHRIATVCNEHFQPLCFLFASKIGVPYTCPLWLILRIVLVLVLRKINKLRVFNADKWFDPHRPYQLSHSLHRTCENREAAKGSIKKGNDVGRG